MDLTNEGALKPPTTPPPVPTQTLQVTPENVVQLAVLFRTAADRLESEAKTADNDLRLDQPWLGDPVSGWIWMFFNKYFVDAENSVARVIQGAYKQHLAHAEALAKAATEYGKRDELNAALLTSKVPG